ncbi:MAG: hypothetical protein JWL77_6302 [Chthonomonadaceae bacterium]|nr:hypothetical protein [Chthonomonadaceae bacterium]
MNLPGDVKYPLQSKLSYPQIKTHKRIEEYLTTLKNKGRTEWSNAWKHIGGDLEPTHFEVRDGNY